MENMIETAPYSAQRQSAFTPIDRVSRPEHTSFPTYGRLHIVPCHGAFKADVLEIPSNPLDDAHWDLFDYQKGGDEPRLYIEHLYAAVKAIEDDPDAVMCISGSYRKGSGSWSEALTYYAIGRHFNWWQASTAEAVHLEEKIAIGSGALDSKENIDESLSMHLQRTGGLPPQSCTVHGFSFKDKRFKHHCALLFLILKNKYLHID